MTSVHNMTPGERAEHGVYIADDSYRTLKGIAGRLADKYPPDWFERNGKELHLHVLGGLSALAVGLSFTAIGWWAWLLPVFGASIITCKIPFRLWGRMPGIPRWAHSAARLDDSDVVLIEQVVACLKPVQLASVTPFLPANTGDRFWEIMWRAEGFKSGHAV
ncbi:hypothetical protein [Pseudoduganella sp. R-34]|uniref:hypothetical protein n=1 Tax=Pseudoduganella sp. R-34 TaxID=3404062 RepID=UPI003CEAD6E1